MVNTPLIIPFLALQVQFDFKTLEFWAKIELWVATNIYTGPDPIPTPTCLCISHWNLGMNSNNNL